ncbi:uncharacterized protein [Dermacentor andersoni]|uniref:uncharacterized protein n=1 Tax=Dermacentor andersoni TaxID=34620 RepID=UPI002416A85B|nr:adult-specific rigid cuticular protein 15.7-like [Dermacentor andersoni]
MFAKCVFSVLCLAVTVSAGIVASSGGHSVQHRKQDDYGNYQFGYDIVNGYGAVNGRHEAGGAYGPVHGSYYLGDIDGRHRQVHYVADKLGFRAVVKTNEPGTKTSAPASAPYVSANGKAVPAASVQPAQVAIVKPVIPAYGGHLGYGYGGGYGGGYGHAPVAAAVVAKAAVPVAAYAAAPHYGYGSLGALGHGYGLGYGGYAGYGGYGGYGHGYLG